MSARKGEGRSISVSNASLSCSTPPQRSSTSPPPRATHWSIILLIVSTKSKISPLTLIVTFFVRSPLATAVVASAIERTCNVRFAAIVFTDSVRSFHVPPTPRTVARPPRRPSVPTSLATRVTSKEKVRRDSTMLFTVAFRSRNSPFTSTLMLWVVVGREERGGGGERGRGGARG